jgi:hypothetical protein
MRPRCRPGQNQEDEVSDEDLVVIPLPTSNGGATYAVARLISKGGQAFAEAIVSVPDTTFAPPRRIALSRYSLARLRPGSPPHRAQSVHLRRDDHAVAALTGGGKTRLSRTCGGRCPNLNGDVRIMGGGSRLLGEAFFRGRRACRASCPECCWFAPGPPGCRFGNGRDRKRADFRETDAKHELRGRGLFRSGRNEAWARPGSNRSRTKATSVRSAVASAACTAAIRQAR